MQEQLSLDDSPGLIPLFVYGTLRTGGALHQWVENGVRDSERAVALDHALYMGPGYPFLVPDLASVVHGEVLWMRNGPELRRTAAMEVRAGYTMELIDVEVDSSPEPLPVLAFTWQQGVAGTYRIPSGEWIAT